MPPGVFSIDPGGQEELPTISQEQIVSLLKLAGAL